MLMSSIGGTRSSPGVGDAEAANFFPVDEGMTNGPPIFAYLVFGPRRVSHERLSRPIKAMV
jgi:hypothetical protein